MLQEHPFLERFSAAKDSGFSGVEILNPYAKPANDVAERLHSAGLECALINVPRGNWDAGERGLGAVKGREAEFEGHVRQGLNYCAALGSPRLHVLAGVGGDHVTYIANLRRASKEAAKQNVTLTIEPLNPATCPATSCARRRRGRR
jgi:2-dehydrotetronate isomerase